MSRPRFREPTWWAPQVEPVRYGVGSRAPGAEALAEMEAEGLTLAEMGVRLGRSGGTVARYFREAGLAHRARRPV